MDIRLTRELEVALTERARQVGSTPEALALDILRERFAELEAPTLEEDESSLADLLDGYIGTLPPYDRDTSEHAPLSENTGAAFARLLQDRKQSDHP